MNRTNSIEQEMERLEDALQSWRRPSGPKTAAQGREVLAGSNLEAVAALSREIARTILRRQLIFTNNRLEQLRIVAAERRILMLELADDTVIVLAPDDAPSLRRATRAVSLFCDNATSLMVQSLLVANHAHEALIGLPAEALTRVEDDDTGTSHTLQDHANCLHGLALSYVCKRAGEVLESWGSTDLIERLKACEDLRDTNTQTCTIWTDPAPNGICIGLVLRDDTALWMAARQENLQQICTAWAALAD